MLIYRKNVKHPRSEDSRKRRNKLRREKRKANKRKEYADEKEERIELEAKVLRLEQANRILKSTVSVKNRTLRIQSRSITYTASALKNNQAKKNSLYQKLKHKVPVFRPCDVMYCKELGEGVYGTLQHGILRSMRQNVAIKTFKDNCSRADVLAEASVLREMSGHPQFPYFFGLVEPRKLLMEYIGSETTSPSLRAVLRNGIVFSHWKGVCMDLVRALKELHNRGILHNDLHPGNILIRELKYVKLIDFGKSTLIEDPVTYKIKPGSEKHKRYNTYHRHLAHELRNVPGSVTTCSSDIYSLGYNFEKISSHVECSKLASVAAKMISANLKERPDLPQILMQLSRL